MSQIVKRLATDRDVPRWVVIAGIVGAILSALAGRYGGRQEAAEQVRALRAEREQLVEQLVEEPIDYEGVPYEVGEHLEDHAVARARFPADRITWWIDPAGVERIRPAVTLVQVQAAMAKAWQQWSDRLDIEPVMVEREADALVRHRFGYIDGGGRTLAYSTLTDGTGRPQEQRYDTGETWTLGGPAPGQISLPTVGAHEIGHAMGLGHDASGSGALMQPTYSSAVPGVTDRDVGRMVSLGYRVRTVPPSVPPVAGTVTVPAVLQVADVVEQLRRQGYTVAPPGK